VPIKKTSIPFFFSPIVLFQHKIAALLSRKPPNPPHTGFETTPVSYGTDIPRLHGDHKRYLYGPGSILVAHSDHEHLAIQDLLDAVKGYKTLVREALNPSRGKSVIIPDDVVVEPLEDVEEDIVRVVEGEVVGEGEGKVEWEGKEGKEEKEGKEGKAES
jgi:hypothetical protein